MVAGCSASNQHQGTEGFQLDRAVELRNTVGEYRIYVGSSLAMPFRQTSLLISNPSAWGAPTTCLFGSGMQCDHIFMNPDRVRTDVLRRLGGSEHHLENLVKITGAAKCQALWQQIPQLSMSYWLINSVKVIPCAG